MEATAIKVPLNKPVNSRFRQQKLSAWKPILTPRTVLPTLFAFGVFFLSLGIPLYLSSEGVKEQTWDYTDCNNINTSSSCADLLNDPSTGYTNTSRLDRRCRCEVIVTLENEFNSQTTFLYYSLTNFYQNHRRYVRSRWDPQLGSKTLSGGSDCDPFTTSPDGRPYMPCGLIANSLFNDTIQMYSCGDDTCSVAMRQKITLSGYHISWASDRNNFFRNPSFNGPLCSFPGWQDNVAARPPNWPVDVCMLGTSTSNASQYNPWSTEFGSSGQGYENEDLIVWMRTAGKKTGRIDCFGLFSPHVILLYST